MNGRQHADASQRGGRRLDNFERDVLYLGGVDATSDRSEHTAEMCLLSEGGGDSASLTFERSGALRGRCGVAGVAGGLLILVNAHDEGVGAPRVGHLPHQHAQRRVVPRQPPLQERTHARSHSSTHYSLLKGRSKTSIGITYECMRRITSRFDCSPPTSANRVPGPWPGHSGFSHVGIAPGDAAGGMFSRGSLVSPALAFRRCSIPTSLHPHRLSRPLPIKLNIVTCRWPASMTGRPARAKRTESGGSLQKRADTIISFAVHTADPDCIDSCVYLKNAPDYWPRSLSATLAVLNLPDGKANCINIAAKGSAQGFELELMSVWVPSDRTSAERVDQRKGSLGAKNPYDKSSSADSWCQTKDLPNLRQRSAAAIGVIRHDEELLFFVTLRQTRTEHIEGRGVCTYLSNTVSYITDVIPPPRQSLLAFESPYDFENSILTSMTQLLTLEPHGTRHLITSLRASDRSATGTSAVTFAFPYTCTV
ncbi:hypothetical protein PR048_027769 [Dryococelus australis]|uniref:Uncharacterized protein n=1 Tax=Dryococelus australis TaxID=614101 RepID=A0ABQ9GHG6_9NEOP|nr:hypothetical protein PR048_027769 [Dryococelus australis]